MRLLLDTHALLWWLFGDPQLPISARTAVGDMSNDVFVSAASAWEITTKVRIGKLPHAAIVAHDIAGAMQAQGFAELAIRVGHGEAAGRLPGPLRDPFDRMLIAQALGERLMLVSNETAFDAYGVQRLW